MPESKGDIPGGCFFFPGTSRKIFALFARSNTRVKQAFSQTDR
jgi:hypothetical protein